MNIHIQSRTIGLKLQDFKPKEVTGKGTFFVTVVLAKTRKGRRFKKKIPIQNLHFKGDKFIGKLVYETPILSQHGCDASRGVKFSRTPVKIVKYVKWEDLHKEIIIWKLYIPKDWTKKINNPRQFKA